MSALETSKRIVVKIGSALLVDEAHGTVHRKWLETLAADLNRLREMGKEVVLVSSGAIAVGRRYLKFADGALRLDEKQAAAAVGQVRLAHAYQEVLAHHDMTVGQVLLTLHDTENRRRYLNARNTLNTLIEASAVPLINENDSVGTAEIRFGDNDRLAARVAAMIGADVLILLSDIEGLYAADPSKNPDAEFISTVRDLTPGIEAMAGDPSSAVGSGGMVTKLAAAKICMANGCSMVISLGTEDHPIARILDGARHTEFVPDETPASARKRWIAGSLKPAGVVIVDDGALGALRKGKSLLPAGVTAVEGDFERGDAVAVKTSNGVEIARGLMSYPADEARLIAGRKSGDIETILGYCGRDSLIHRDDLVLS